MQWQVARAATSNFRAYFYPTPPPIIYPETGIKNHPDDALVTPPAHRWLPRKQGPARRPCGLVAFRRGAAALVHVDMFAGTPEQVVEQARAEGISVLEPTMQALIANLQEATDGFAESTFMQASPDDHGWMDPCIMGVFSRLRPWTAARPLLLVEVGSWKGQSAMAFAKRLQEIGEGNKLVCIDTWLGAPEFWTWGLRDRSRGGSLKRCFGLPHVYYTFLSNIFRKNLQDVVAPFPISSAQGAEVLRHYQCQADAVYVDGSHEEAAVLGDMHDYWAVLAPGGVMFGDDYCDEWPGVRAAVQTFASSHGVSVEVHGIVWFLLKPS